MRLFRNLDSGRMSGYDGLVAIGVEGERQGLTGQHTTYPNICSRRSSFLEARFRSADFVAERERLVRGLIAEGLLHSPDVIAAMRKVPREFFLSENLRSYAYDDTPLPTEHGQTISAPHGVGRAIHGRHNE